MGVFGGVVVEQGAEPPVNEALDRTDVGDLGEQPYRTRVDPPRSCAVPIRPPGSGGYPLKDPRNDRGSQQTASTRNAVTVAVP